MSGEMKKLNALSSVKVGDVVIVSEVHTLREPEGDGVVISGCDTLRVVNESDDKVFLCDGSAYFKGSWRNCNGKYLYLTEVISA